MQPISPSSSARVVRTLLCVDVVESVRLIQDDEEGAVRRWQQLVERISATVLPAHGGRLVKSLGDGMLLEFAHVPAAVAAAFAIQDTCRADNAEQLPHRQMLVRIGANAGEFIADAHDVYGHEVNLAARLTTLAGPGEIVVSATVRDQLTPLLDADVEDLGECFLKHVREPVRAYRLGPPGAHPVIDARSTRMPELKPTVAVIPFTARGEDPGQDVLGEVFADEIIAAISRTAELHVISRLSTTAFRGRNTDVAEVSSRLAAGYVVTGAYRVSGSRVTTTVELVETQTGYIAWADSLQGDVPGVLRGEDPLVSNIVKNISRALVARELQRAQTQALPTLESCTLLLGAIVLMHRLSGNDFDRAHAMLIALTERTPHQAVPYAWLAKWHVLRANQGWSPDVHQEARLALDATKRALDMDPDCSLALAVDGFANATLVRNLDAARDSYERALAVNPNDSLAWLLKGTMHAFRGEGELAMENVMQARRLSPLDPLRYFFDSLSATAALSANDFQAAADFAATSYRLNRRHASTLRALIVSQWRLGRADEARKFVGELLEIEPGFTVSRWFERSPSSGFPIGTAWASALREAGVPA